jgi:small subunit ribosomal protein S21e
MATIGTINEEGVNVDMYIPRKCHATNSLITADDFGSVQIAIAEIDANGVATGETKTFCLAGYLRTQAESDHAINRLCITHGIIRPKTGKKSKKQQKKRSAPAAKGKAAPAAKGKAAPAKGKAAPAKGKAAPAAKGKAPAKAAAAPAKEKAAPAKAAAAPAKEKAAPAKPAAKKAAPARK